MSERTFDIRLAEEHEFAEIGDVTVRGYVNDDLLSHSDFYATRLRDVASRAADSEVWVGVDEQGKVLGSVTFCPLGSSYRELATDEDGEFRMLSVDPSARGMGVGRALVEQCVKRGRELGFKSLVLCSAPDMHAARRLYAGAGFVREPELDWSPVEGVYLEGFRLNL